MVKVLEFDMETYNATKGTGCPIVTVVEREYGEILPATDEDGNVTLGGKIGYYIAYGIMAGFLAYWFWM